MSNSAEDLVNYLNIFLRVIRLQNFPKKFFALKVSFELSKSQCLGIIGLNGSGKGTLMQLIMEPSRQSSGSLEVNGKVAALLE